MASEVLTTAQTGVWSVGGMDCAGCAAKIRSALERKPGVENVHVSLARERLTLSLDESLTTAGQIEQLVRRLGYSIEAVGAEGPKKPEAPKGTGGASHDHAHQLQGDATNARHDHRHHGREHTHDHDDCCAGAATEASEQPIKEHSLVWSVGGMDCAGCAAKIRGALERMPGVKDVRVSVVGESLMLALDETETPASEIESAVRGLGYSIAPADAEAAGPVAPAEGAAGGKSWIRTSQGRLVLGTGLLLAAAWAFDLTTSSAIGYWAFVAACLIGLVPIAKRAFAALRAGVPFTIEMLMTVAAGGALVIDAAPEAALVIFQFTVGESLEGVAADRARKGIRALGALVPKTALVEENGGTREVAASSLRIGQVVLVRPGDRVAADGEVLDGVSGVNESPVTGESVPRSKRPGDAVFAGSINSEAALRVRVIKAPEDNTIARIVRLVEEAQEARAPTERFIDRFSRIYMPIIVVLAALVAVGPPLVVGAPWETWIYRGLALLLIGCPCALVISVPASIASALSAGARRGLLLKGGAVIEAAAKTTLVAFDKTGTLTAGQPVVTDVLPLDAEEAELLSTAAAVEAASSHPLGKAIAAHARARGLAAPEASDARAHAGRGVEATVRDRRAFAGSPAFARDMAGMPEAATRRAASLEAEGKTVVAVFREDAILGLIALRDEPRAEARAAVRRLGKMGVRAVMLTGDNCRTATAIANDLGIEQRSELLPEGKVAAIRELSAKEHVMMVGDGINDAPALATAHVGVAMGSGTEVALETADGAILRNRVMDVAEKIRLARATMANIRQNIAIALGLKAIFLVTTVLGFTGLWLAILADTGATVLVTLNALRLLGFDAQRARQEGLEDGQPDAPRPYPADAPVE
ncbi:MAG: heavy metal translocating P-type ATPase [Alphaproteobacteria bacterium]